MSYFRACVCERLSPSQPILTFLNIFFLTLAAEKKSCAHIKRALNYKKIQKIWLDIFIVYPHSHRRRSLCSRVEWVREIRLTGGGGEERRERRRRVECKILNHMYECRLLIILSHTCIWHCVSTIRARSTAMRVCEGSGKKISLV